MFYNLENFHSTYWHSCLHSKSHLLYSKEVFNLYLLMAIHKNEKFQRVHIYQFINFFQCSAFFVQNFGVSMLSPKRTCIRNGSIFQSFSHSGLVPLLLLCAFRNLALIRIFHVCASLLPIQVDFLSNHLSSILCSVQSYFTVLMNRYYLFLHVNPTLPW